MGAANKLLQPLGGQAMLRRVVEQVSASELRSCVVVTGHQSKDIESALHGQSIHLAYNANWEEGMGTSIAKGVAALGAGCDAAIIVLGDMPWLRSSHLDALVAAFDPQCASICAPALAGKRGNPVLWGRRYFPELSRLRGEVGGKSLLKLHPVHLVEVHDDAPLIDVDTPEALAAARNSFI